MTLYQKHDKFADRADFAEYLTDFHLYTAGDWTVTKVGTGTAALVAASPYGELLITNSAADDDNVQHQWAGGAQWSLIQGKKLSFRTRFKVSDATQSDLWMGLATVDTTLVQSAPTDGIYFRKDDGDTLLDFVMRKAGVEVSLLGILGTPTAIAANTYYDVGFYYNGDLVSQRGNQATVDVFVNKTRVGSLKVADAPTAALCLGFALQNGEAVAKNATWDFLRVRQER